MLPFASTASTQIRFLLHTCTDSNFDSFVVDYGSEGSILLLATCLDHMNFYGGEDSTSSINLKPQLLSAIFRYQLDKPNFSTVLCQALRNVTVPHEFLLRDVLNELKFSVSEKIAFGLALSDSEELDIRSIGQSFCMSQIEKLCANAGMIDSNEQIQNIVLFLSRSEGVAKLVDSFIQMVSLLEIKNRTPLILSPLCNSDDTCEVNSPRQLDLFYKSSENDFDDILAEIEKEMSMADIVKELGYGCTVNATHCKDILSIFLPLTEVTICKILSTIARNHVGLEDLQSTHSTFCSAVGISSFADSSSLSSWNVDALVESIKQLAPDTNWVHVMENLDHEGFYLPSEDSFSFFMSVYASACQVLIPSPLHAICGAVWNNAEGQISFLRYAVSASPEIFTFVHSTRQLVYVDAVHGHKLSTGNGNQAWLCLDLLDVLCQLAETGHAGSVRSMLEYPLKHCPEVLLLGLSQTNVLTYVTTFILLLSTLYTHLNFVLQILCPVLDMAPFSFSIKLAALSSVKEQINLEKWLSDKLSTYGDTFVEACLMFLKEIRLGVPQDVPANSFQHSSAVVLLGHAGQNVSRHHLLVEMKNLHAVFIQNSTNLQNGGAGNLSLSDGGYPDDIEAESNSYFQQMFSGQLSIDAMVQMLARYKESPEKREQSIYECMIWNLFDKYTFFPEYPERQLRIAAVLFGSLIKHQLVTHLTLGTALRGVLDALRKSADSKMFVFGVKALEQFVDRLIEWPQYCNHILQISHLRTTQLELVTFIERALATISSSHSELNGGNIVPTDQHQGPNPVAVENMEVSESSWKIMGSRGSSMVQARAQPSLSPFQLQPLLYPAGQQQSLVSTHDVVVNTQKASVAQPLATGLSQNAPSGPGSVSSSPGFLRPSRGITSTSIPRQQSYSTGFGSALSLETLLVLLKEGETPIEVPEQETRDRILFMINNLSVANADTKAKEFTDVLKEEFYPWFAQYMVMKRVSIELNFHDLYLKFLDKVNSRILNQEILKTTYENCKVLLRSELIKSSSEERSLLKNLGSWLGKFTIGRNQALRAKEIAPKVLIIEAYEKGLMIAVIPFTSKVSILLILFLAYQPPNPWTMGILSLLAEIYALPNLKMNLKFDIEVLFKNLGVDMKDVKPTSLLKDRSREVEGNPDFSNKDVTATQPLTIPEVNTLISVEPQPEIANSSLPGGHSNALPQLPTPIPNIGTDVIVNPKIALSLQMEFQSNLPFFVLTQLLATELFLAMERAIKEIMSPVVQRSVTIAIQTTKELVLKEPLRVSISSHLRNLIQALGPSSDFEQAVQISTNDNLDLGCAVVEKAAIEKALQTIDGEIAEQLSVRRKHREAVGPAYFDATTYTQFPLSLVPEALRPNPRRSLSQQRVYEDFVRFPWQNQPSQSTNALPAGQATSFTGDSGCSNLPRSNGPASGQLNSTVYSTVQGGPGFVSVAQPLDLISEDMDPASAQTHSSSSAHVGVADVFTQHGSNRTSTVPSFPSTIISVEPISVDPSDSTKALVRQTLYLLRDALDKYQAVAQKVQLENLIAKDSTDVEIELGTKPGSSESLPQLLEIAAPSIHSHVMDEESMGTTGKNDAAVTHFMSQLQQSGLLKGDDMTDRLFRLLTELSVSHCLSTEGLVPGSLSLQSPQQVPVLSFIAVDMYAKLVILILKYCAVDQGSTKLFLLPKILLVTVRVIQKDADEKKTAFNPRPYFRLFNSFAIIILASAMLSPSCIQMRNVILSAFPRKYEVVTRMDFIRKPLGYLIVFLPFSVLLFLSIILTILKMIYRSILPNKPMPCIFSDVDAALKAKQMKSDIDEYLKATRAIILDRIEAESAAFSGEVPLAGTRYNVPLINSLVLYVGMQIIFWPFTGYPATTKPRHQPHVRPHTTPMDIFLVGSAMNIFQTLIGTLIQKVAKMRLQSRYPTTILLLVLSTYLLKPTRPEVVQEQITQGFIERLIVNRPHPWGLLITFIELIKNPRYVFLDSPFTRDVLPRLKKLFESVSRSCGGSKAVDESLHRTAFTDSSWIFFQLCF
ncbi:hypothetical protein MKW92_020455 [Papaver armeniacum]|nr:hypothetical protein MKW92_020455 [Papaver armeniacum]